MKNHKKSATCKGQSGVLEILNNVFRTGRQNRAIEKTGNGKMGGMLWK
jgi:hypothetical protein